MKEHFIAGWGGYPIIGSNDQVVEGLATLADHRARRHRDVLAALRRGPALVPDSTSIRWCSRRVCADCHHPRKRMIQYSLERRCIHPIDRGYWMPDFAGMTG